VRALPRKMQRGREAEAAARAAKARGASPLGMSQVLALRAAAAMRTRRSYAYGPQLRARVESGGGSRASPVRTGH
jgi:hypothetical protein